MQRLCYDLGGDFSQPPDREWSMQLLVALRPTQAGKQTT
jgi:hypothetical protein